MSIKEDVPTNSTSVNVAGTAEVASWKRLKTAVMRRKKMKTFKEFVEQVEDLGESTHVVHLHKIQRGGWGSTVIGEKKVKIHVPVDDKLGVAYHASRTASKAGYKKLRNGDSVSWSVHKVEES